MERAKDERASSRVPSAKGGPAVPLNRIHEVGTELGYISEAIENAHLSGVGPFTARCTRWLEERSGCVRALLTSSATSALEMATSLAGIGPGDEVIMPSFTFTSTATAVVGRGATPVFADIREDTLNLDEAEVATAVTSQTRALMPVHYAGVGCEMNALQALAGEHGLRIIEDAAQGILASYRGRALGSIGHAGVLSFHDTKNVTCGEGGALLVNEPGWIEQAEILLDKGTNRAQFLRGHADRYTWVDLGSSYLMSEINAAFLWAQLEAAEQITRSRFERWQSYHDHFGDLEAAGRLRRPVLPAGCEHNAHIYYLLVADRRQRDSLIAHLAEHGVGAAFHYVPLHSSPAGRRFGRSHGELPVTEAVSDRLIRLPLWPELSDEQLQRVVEVVTVALGARAS